MDLVPLDRVAEQLELPLSTLQRWMGLYCWEDARAERELALMQRVQGVRHSLVPDIDRKHDEMFASLESLLQTTIRELSDAGQPIPPHHLKTLASTLVACQAGRRVVHKKEQGISKQVVEFRENPEVYESFVQSLADLASRGENGRQLSEQVPSLPALPIMDAEFEKSDEEV